jgi:phage baseplate assembly protein W
MTTPTAPDPFGRGLLLDDGDLVFRHGDLVEVTGIENLVQALTTRILTPLGSDPFNTRYGLDVTSAFTEPNSPRTAKELLRLSLVGALGTDPRVSDVHQITFDDDPERLAAGPEAVARARTARITRAWSIEADVDTVAGIPVTLRVNVEV